MQVNPLAALSQYNTVILGLAAVVAGVFSPILMAWLTNRNARAIKLEDWKRQDEVAKQLASRQDELEKKASELAARSVAAGELQVESNKKIVEIAKIQVAKIEQIHTLVNSNLTASMQVQLEFAESGLNSLKEILSLKLSSGIELDPETLANLEITKAKIAELKKQLKEREDATLLAEKNVRTDIVAAQKAHTPIDPSASLPDIPPFDSNKVVVKGLETIKDPEVAIEAAEAALRQANRIEDVGIDTNKAVKRLKSRVTDVEIDVETKKDKK